MFRALPLLILFSACAAPPEPVELNRPFGFTDFGLTSYVDTDDDGLPDTRLPDFDKPTPELNRPFGTTAFGLTRYVDTDDDGLPDTRLPDFDSPITHQQDPKTDGGAQLMLRREKVAVTMELYELSKGYVEKARLRYKTGRSSDEQLFAARRQMLSARLDLIDARLELETAGK